MRERVAVVGEPVGEKGRVEVETDALFAAPVDPALEMFRRERVALDGFAVRFGVRSVEVQPVRPGQKRERLRDVRAKFLRRAGAAGIISGGLDAAAALHIAEFFETGDVVALPAVKRNRKFAGAGKSGFGVDASSA